QQIDKDMQNSVYLAEEALKLNATEGLTQLKQALDLACACFVRWGLTSGKVAEHLNQLREAGAIAVKPTGSGDGGFVLSLWQQKPQNLSIELITL
ncbi:MAG: Mevalonate kinase, partial [Gammaproteobacteria bacterium]|nr:Mevalonate kinase [Gammaproteobacteria bacterium]